jgi:hemerythrin-like domain-containing protein
MRAIDILQAEHRVKEEEILFPAMVEAGFPRNSGQIAAMLHEHSVSRSYNWVLYSLARQRLTAASMAKVDARCAALDEPKSASARVRRGQYE